MKVQIRRNQLNYFRKLARESKKEQYAYLVGEVETLDRVRVHYFVYPSHKDFDVQTEGEVQVSADFEAETVAESFEQGLSIVGTIHSHPNWWPVLSSSDMDSHVRSQHRISGICAVMGRKTKVYFWVAESSLPCKIEYF